MTETAVNEVVVKSEMQELIRRAAELLSWTSHTYPGDVTYRNWREYVTAAENFLNPTVSK